MNRDSETTSDADLEAQGESAFLDPYRDSALLYLEAGWASPLPVETDPVRAPKGFTGKDGVDPTPKQIEQWRRSRPRAQIGLRVASDVVGLDVDAYDGKPGAETMAALEEECGPLPPTWLSTSRWPEDQVSGIRYFTVPADTGDELRDQPGVDIIRRVHRFGFAWPSIGRRTGKRYRWIDPDGQLLEEGSVPHVEDLPRLPDRWLERLRVHSDADMRSTPRPAPSKTHRGEITVPGGDSYGQAAARDELGALAATPEGGRNRALFLSSVRLAELVAGGHLHRAETVGALTGTARRIGLTDQEVRSTIASAFSRAQPRHRDLVGSILADIDDAGDEELTGPAKVDSRKGLTWANELLGLEGSQRIVRFTRELTEPPTYAIHGKVGTGRLTSKQVSRADSLRGAILEATGVNVASLQRGGTWALVGTALAEAAEDVDMGDDATSAGRTCYWLLMYLQGGVDRGLTLAEAVEGLPDFTVGAPPLRAYRDESFLVVNASHLADTLNRTALKVDPQVLRRGLRDLGATPYPTHHGAGGGRSTSSFWHVPLTAL